MERATAYLGTFTIDPVALRQQGVKGLKKLVELFDAYVALHRRAKGARRSALEKRFREVAAVTGRPEYHDMATVSDEQFHQDATSYLRACYLMDQMGLDTAAYRRDIEKVRPRLDAHLASRGPNQRMAFAFYYRTFKLAEPAILRVPSADAVIARRLSPYRMTLKEVYDLTHEVFVPFDYGGNLAVNPFTSDEREYLLRTLEILTTVYLHQRDIDIVGELLACLRYLGDTDLAAYREGLDALLSSQRENGSFGDYERYRARRGALLELDLYLHTTSVALDILPAAFDPRTSLRSSTSP
jgi:hypothetical protein